MKTKNKTPQKALKKTKKLKYRVFELEIPKKYYPRVKGNKTNEYLLKNREILMKLHDLELDLEMLLGSIKNRKEILFSEKRRKIKRPTNLGLVSDLKKEISFFSYEYENYCLRVYIYRETIVNFISAFFGIEKNKKIYYLMDDTLIKELKIDKPLKFFIVKGVLKDIIEYRNKLTHKAEIKKGNEGKEIGRIIKDYEEKVKLVNSSLTRIKKINDDIAKKICVYKECEKNVKK